MARFEELKTQAFGRITTEELSPELLEDVKLAAEQEVLDETLYSNEMATINGLGGIAAGETFANVPVKDMLTKLLYPYVKPALSAVTENVNGGTFEKGTVHSNQKIKAVVTKKSEQISEVVFLDGSVELKKLTGAEVQNGGTFYSEALADIKTNKNFKVKIKDTKNSVVEATTGTYNYVHPIYTGKLAADVTAPTAEQIKGLTKKVTGVSSQTVGYTVANERMVIAVPSNWTLKSAIDPNKFDMTGAFGLVLVDVVCLDESTEKYKVYMSAPTNQTAFNVTFNF